MLQSKTKIGERDREITFIQAVIEQGTSGEDKITGWELIEEDPNVNAKKEESAGSTVVQSDRVTWNRQTTWNIHSRTDLNVRMRVVYNTQVYEIIDIHDADEERGRSINVVSNLLDNIFFT